MSKHPALYLPFKPSPYIALQQILSKNRHPIAVEVLFFFDDIPKPCQQTMGKKGEKEVEGGEDILPPYVNTICFCAVEGYRTLGR
jgi:hypothetical protein